MKRRLRANILKTAPHTLLLLTLLLSALPPCAAGGEGDATAILREEGFSATVDPALVGTWGGWFQTGDLSGYTEFTFTPDGGLTRYSFSSAGDDQAYSEQIDGEPSEAAVYGGALYPGSPGEDVRGKEPLLAYKVWGERLILDWPSGGASAGGKALLFQKTGRLVRGESPAAVPGEDQPAGTYFGKFGGEFFDLTLTPDGRFTLLSLRDEALGDTGVWTFTAPALTLTGGKNTLTGEAGAFTSSGGYGTLTLLHQASGRRCPLTRMAGPLSRNPLQGWTRPPKPGDVVTLGHYEQDNNPLNGKEPIRWIILKTDGRTALVVSEMGLDAKPYLVEHTDVTWETSGLRAWLNGDFLAEAFTRGEEGAILRVRNQNEDNPEYGTRGGADTDDRVFLLSIREAGLFPDDSSRRVNPTFYAAAQGAGRGTWWLRSPGYDSDHDADSAACVEIEGHVDNFGDAAWFDSNIVRPALYIDLSAGVF